jgi:hypothetical protein
MQERLDSLRAAGAPSGAFVKLALDAANDGNVTLAYDAAVEVAVRGGSEALRAQLALDLGRSRYEHEGAGFVRSMRDEPPRQLQVVGALRVAAKNDAVDDVDVLREHLPVEVRREVLHSHFAGGDALSWHNDRRPSLRADDLPRAATIAEEDGAAPYGLLWQLSERGMDARALHLADRFVRETLSPLVQIEPDHPWARWPPPVHAVIMGLATREAFSEALALAEARCSGARLASTVTEIGKEYVDRRGPSGVGDFLRRLGKRDQPELLGHVAGWKARRGDAAIIDETVAAKGMMKFHLQVAGFFGYLAGGHLDLAERLLPLADSSQKKHQREKLAEARAATGGR